MSTIFVPKTDLESLRTAVNVMRKTDTGDMKGDLSDERVRNTVLRNAVKYLWREQLDRRGISISVVAAPDGTPKIMVTYLKKDASGSTVFSAIDLAELFSPAELRDLHSRAIEEMYYEKFGVRGKTVVAAAPHLIPGTAGPVAPSRIPGKAEIDVTRVVKPSGVTNEFDVIIKLQARGNESLLGAVGGQPAAQLNAELVNTRAVGNKIVPTVVPVLLPLSHEWVGSVESGLHYAVYKARITPAQLINAGIHPEVLTTNNYTVRVNVGGQTIADVLPLGQVPTVAAVPQGPVQAPPAPAPSVPQKPAAATSTPVQPGRPAVAPVVDPYKTVSDLYGQLKAKLNQTIAGTGVRFVDAWKCANTADYYANVRGEQLPATVDRSYSWDEAEKLRSAFYTDEGRKLRDEVIKMAKELRDKRGDALIGTSVERLLASLRDIS